MGSKKQEILRSNVTTFLGSFALAVPTGLITTLAAGAQIFSMQWADSTRLALIRRIGVMAVITTAFGTAQEMGFDAVVARGFTVAGSGGTNVDLTVSNKLRTGQSASLIAASSMRVATTAALTAGTQTLDTQAVGSTSFWATAIGATLARTDLFDARDVLGNNHLADQGDGLPLRSPLVLAANEGFVIRNTVLMGATGVARAQVFVEWDEVLA